MSADHSPVRQAARQLACFIAATLVIASCTQSNGNLQGPIVLTAQNIDSLPADTVLAIAARQSYDSSPGVSDTATVVEGNRQAVIAFDPVVGGRERTIDELKRGLFVAHWRRDGDSVRYPMRSPRGYVWMDSGATGWNLRFYSSDPQRGYSRDSAFTIEDANQKDASAPQRSIVDREADAIGPLHCYYTDSRWVCPRFDLLTFTRVQSAYDKRPN